MILTSLQIVGRQGRGEFVHDNLRFPGSRKTVVVGILRQFAEGDERLDKLPIK